MALDPYHVCQTHGQIAGVIVEIVRESRRLMDELAGMVSEHHQLRMQPRRDPKRLRQLRELMEDHLHELKELARLGAEQADSFYTW
jgi:hypothetical protein